MVPHLRHARDSRLPEDDYVLPAIGGAIGRAFTHFQVSHLFESVIEKVMDREIYLVSTHTFSN